MTIALYTNSVSPHQLPLARELIQRVGTNNYRYIYSEPFCREREQLGWSLASEPWIISSRESPANARKWLHHADILISGIRDVELFEARRQAGLKTFYCSERWFKPIMGVPGSVRRLFPKYRAMEHRFVDWVNGDLNAKVLAIGPWAFKDFVRMGVASEKIRLWGYFVQAGNPNIRHALQAQQSGRSPLKLLWAGRLLRWKRVTDIVRAVAAYVRLKRVTNQWADDCPEITLTIIGEGPEKVRLVKLVSRLGLAPIVTFLPAQPISRIRELMRLHNCYILASNGYEGWGAVVSEALEEGLSVLGTYESGSCPTLLPQARLYHAGDWRALVKLIDQERCGELPSVSIGEWSAARGAERFLELCK